MTEIAEKRPVLSDPREMIEVLGGAKAVAEMLGLTSGNPRITVNQWKTRGIPWPKRATLARLLGHAGYDVAPEFLEPAGE